MSHSQPRSTRQVLPRWLSPLRRLAGWWSPAAPARPRGHKALLTVEALESVEAPNTFFCPIMDITGG